MAVTCPHCGELAYAEGTCEHCGASLAPAAPAGEHDALAWPGAAVDLVLMGTPWAGASAEGAQHAREDMPAPQGQLHIRKLPQDPPATDEGRQWDFALDGRQISIGRAPSCDLTLESDLLVSRRHAIISARNGMHLVLDLGSSNGTWVNDVVITEETPLHAGDTLRIGEYELVYSMASAVLETPAAPVLEAAAAVPAPQEAAPEYTDMGSRDVAWRAGDVAENHHQPVVSSPGEPEGDRADSVAQPFLTRDPLTTPVDHNLESLESQVVGLVTALRQQAEEDARYAGGLKEVMSQVQQALAELVGRYGTLPTDGAALDELLTVVHQAADNPRHLDYVTGLAMNAGAIAHVLDALRALYAPHGLLDSLAVLKERLDQTLG